MAETQSAASQAKEMQSRTAKPEAVRKDAEGNLLGANITSDGVPIPQVREIPGPGLVQSGLVGGVGISGSGQDQDAAEVEAKGNEENERRADEAKEAEERAAAQEAEAAKANEASAKAKKK